MRLQPTAQLAAKNHASSFASLAQPQKQCHSTILKALTLFSQETLAVSLGAPEALAVGWVYLNTVDIIKSLESDSDPNKVLKDFNKYCVSVNKGDLPLLLQSINSTTSNYFSREMLAIPIIKLAGTTAIPVLMQALRKNYEDGHDNDSLQMLLSDLAIKKPIEARKELEKMKLFAKDKELEDIEWLLDYCR